jgi:hypothetical protein
MSDCKAYRHEIVEAFDDGVMSRGARAHAEACPACGDERRGRENLRALVRSLDKVEAPSDFEYRLRARMAASGAPGRRVPPRGLRLVYAFAPVAAAACFLVVSTALYLRQAGRTSPAQAPVVAASGAARDAGAGEAAANSAAVAVEEARRTGVRSTESESKTMTLPVRTSVQRTRGASRPSREVAARFEGRAAGLQRNTTVASVIGAQVITGRGVPFPLKTPGEPMRMILRDERGAGRVVPMRAVSFGSQELIAREGVSRRAPAAENEGVW